MVKNRFFKSTFGAPAEMLIAQALDATTGAIAGSAATGTASVTVAANTTNGDQIVLTVGSHTFNYASVGAVTAAAYGTALLAALNLDPYFVANGIVWTKAGTTSLVLTGTWPIGALPNGTAINFEAGPVNAGPSFSAFSSTNATGGTNAVVGMQPDVKGFVANALSGTLGVYWDDTNLVLQPGDTYNPANYGRKFSYFWKQGGATTVGLTMRTSPIPVRDRAYTQVAYAAGTNQVSTVTFTGTYAAGQILHLRLSDTTGTVVPYPNFAWETPFVTDLTTTLAALAALINAELASNDPFFTATSNATQVIITANDASRSFQTSFYLETTAAQPTDASIVTHVVTTGNIAPLGTLADVQEFENYFKVGNGVMIYTPEGTIPAEFGVPVTNAVTAINYGYLIVTMVRVERGETRDYTKKTYVVVALPTASLATLASI